MSFPVAPQAPRITGAINPWHSSRVRKFAGYNSTKNPYELSEGIGRLCDNLLFTDGVLVARYGFSKIVNSAATIRVNTALCAYSLMSSEEFSGGHPYQKRFVLSASCADENLDGIFTEYIKGWWAGGIETYISTIKSNTPGAYIDNARASFTLCNGRVIYGNGYQTVYFRPKFAITSTSTFRILQLPKPAAPTVALFGAGGINGSQQYYVVYKDPITGAISEPSAPTSHVAVNESTTVTFNGGNGPYSDYIQMVYRKPGNSAFAYYVGESAGAAILDIKLDEQLGLSMVLNNTAFPECGILETWKGRLVGAYTHPVDTNADGIIDIPGTYDYINISYLAQPWRCPLVTDITNPLDGVRIPLQPGGDTEITAIKAFGDILLIWTKNEMYMLTGDDASTWKITKVSPTGCVCNNTVCIWKGAVIWLEARGVYLWDGKGDPIMVSYPIKTELARIDYKALRQSSAFIYSDRYHVSAGGYTFCLDMLETLARSGQYEPEDKWLWSRFTGWQWLCCASVPGSRGSEYPDIYFSQPNITVSAGPVYAYKNAWSLYVFQLDINNPQDDTTNVTYRWISGLIPASRDTSRIEDPYSRLAYNKRKFWLRSISVNFVAQSATHVLYPLGANTNLTITLHVNGDTASASTHIIDLSQVAPGIQDYIVVEEDCDSTVAGNNIQFEMSGVSFISNIQSGESEYVIPQNYLRPLFPIINSLEFMLVALR